MSDATKNRNLAMEAVRVTEAAALAASHHMGRGDEKAADEAAVGAIREALAGLDIDGVISIGEGPKQSAPHLFEGERVGTGNGPEVDLAILPLEGPTIIAKGEPNGISVIAMTRRGGFPTVPKLYMEKIAVGGGLPQGVVSLDASPEENLAALAEAKGVGVGEIVACILDRPRHNDLIRKVRAAGARIMLIADGDVSGVVATAWPDAAVDIYMGIGGAREGVLSSAALACVGGQMEARLVLRNDDERMLAEQYGISDTNRIFGIEDMPTGDDVTFAATGVTNGAILTGVRRLHNCAVTHSLVMRSSTGNLHLIEAFHNFAGRRSEGADA